MTKQLVRTGGLNIGRLQPIFYFGFETEYH